MACCDVESFIKYLHTYGGDVLSGRSKLVVTPKILKDVNEVTQSVKEDIYVSPLTNTDLLHKYSKNKDLMFLYDFIQKTPKLKISNSVSSHKFAISVGDFHNLRSLELYKFNVKYVRGIQLLRENLEMVVCVRCLDKVSDLLLGSDSNAYVSSIPSIWNKLKYAVLSQNSLSSVDESFIHTPWLQYLDISYNNLSDIRPLLCLRNLTHLNASNNRLTEFPKFAMYKLEVLILNNNFLTNISGISSLESLQQCNLAANCLAEHATLISLAELSELQSLNIQGNPIAHHPMHRSLTCGYLHEHIANTDFLLDNRPLTSAEREFIRYSCRGSTLASNASSRENIARINDLESIGIHVVEQKVRVGKAGKPPREAIINDRSLTSDICESAETSFTVVPDEESVDKEITDMKKQREEEGADVWLWKLSTARVDDIIGIRSSTEKSSEEGTSADAEELVSVQNTDDAPNHEGSVSNSSPSERAGFETATNEDSGMRADSDGEHENSIDSQELDSTYDNEVEKSDGWGDETGVSDTHYDDIISEKNPWVVERVKDDKNNDSLFLILNESELKEVDPAKMRVITRWSIDCVGRYIKISNEPFTLKLIFDVMKRDNRQRTYLMEYPDAKVLMERIDAELESRNFHKILHFRCMKCDALFCHELPERSCRNPHASVVYACTNCKSTAVLQEDDPALKSESVYQCNDMNVPSKSVITDPLKDSKVTQSPSLSSIGSAASLEQNADIESCDVSQTSRTESDVEIISNPSESSVEILRRETISVREPKAELRRLSERPSISEISTGDFRSEQATLNQMLTESSSSGSMTDSSCTTVESNYLNRGSHRISQSVLDETLLEESSSIETSPQQRHSITESEMTEISILDKRSETLWSTMLKSVSPFLMLPSSTPRTNDLDFVPSTPFEYSYTDFGDVDHRIKLYFWDKVTTQNEEICAFIRVNMILKTGCPNQLFSGLVFFTCTKMYLVKIVDKEIDEDPNVWLQKYDSVLIEKIKLIKPVLEKQGFSVNTEDRLPSGENIRYIMFLYDQKRTENFLSFLKDSGIIHVQEVEDSSETQELIRMSPIQEDIRNITVTDTIVVRHKDGGDEIYNFVTLVITEEEFFILKLDEAWSSLNGIQAPKVLRQERIADLLTVKETEDGVSLQFEDETEGIEKSWIVNTVSRDATSCILEAIREPWERIFDVQSSASQAIVN